MLHNLHARLAQRGPVLRGAENRGARANVLSGKQQPVQAQRKRGPQPAFAVMHSEDQPPTRLQRRAAALQQRQLFLGCRYCSTSRMRIKPAEGSAKSRTSHTLV